jgi:hypothetical protein
VNGVLAARTNAVFDLQGIPLSVGQQHMGEDYFEGQVDEVRIYSRALSAADIVKLIQE